MYAITLMVELLCYNDLLSHTSVAQTYWVSFIMLDVNEFIRKLNFSSIGKASYPTRASEFV